MRWFCKHRWEKLSEAFLMSPYDQMGGLFRVTQAQLPAWLFDKTHVVILACRRCDKVRRLVTRSRD